MNWYNQIHDRFTNLDRKASKPSHVRNDPPIHTDCAMYGQKAIT